MKRVGATILRETIPDNLRLPKNITCYNTCLKFTVYFLIKQIKSI